mgnify:CR=1 FL=1
MMESLRSINKCGNWVGIFALFYLLVAFSGCKSRKKIQNVGDKPIENVVLTKAKVFENLNKNWTYYSSKSKVAVEGKGIDKTVDLTLKMKKDEIVWASIGMFGFEGARIFMESDSITLINKINKSYSRMGWKEIETYTGSRLSLKDVQSILIANPIFTDFNNYKNDTSNATFFIRKSDSTTYELTSNSIFTTIIKTFLVGQKSGKHLTIDYSNYNSIDEKQVPLRIKIIAKDGLDIFNIDMQINDLNFNSFETLPTQIPSTFIRD